MSDTAITLAPFGWVITEDHISEPDDTNDVGRYYPPDIADVELIQEKGREFRILDADGVLYYVGKLLMPENESETPKVQWAGGVWDEDWEFHPLTWAKGWAGASDIQYKNNDGKWESL